MNKRKTPAIRFKGYQNDWEQRKIGDCFLSLQNNTLSRADLSDENGVVMNVHYGDVLIKFEECLDVSKERLPFVKKQSVADKFATSYLKNGDVIVADTAEDETVGKCTEIIGLTDQKVISGLHTIPLRPNGQFATGYLGFYLNSAAYHTQLKPLMQGIKVTSISKSAMQDTVIKYPSDVKEQALIGQYFMNIDHLITLHQRKLDKLKILKKTMLENCFPQKGESVPRVRFGGFTGYWEQRKVGELTNVLSASRVHKEEWAEDGIPFFRSSDVVSAFKGTENKKAFISIELYEQLAKSSGKLEQNDILITGGGSIGIPYIVPDNKPLYSKDADLIWIKHSANFDSRYLYTYFISEEFREYLASISHMGTIAHYTIEQVKDTPVRLPSIDEQRELGDFFVSLDHLITLHQCKLEKLQTIKKSLLRSMFV